VNKLYPFQKGGVRWFEKNNGVGLLGDEMGLGKTIQALAYLDVHPELRPVLIACPASVKLNWQNEIKKWTGQEAFVMSGTKGHILPDYPFYIINYDILSGRAKKTLDDNGKPIKKRFSEPEPDTWTYFLEKVGLRVFIGDEVQYISNNKAIRTKHFIHIKRTVKPDSFIGLSGTPIRNRPAEFFTILNLLDNKTFPNRWKYLHAYCDPKHNGFGMTFLGATNIDKLHELIQPLMLRRLKADVLPELPPKRKLIVPMELDKAELASYRGADKEFLDWLRGHLRAGIEGQQQLEKLKQLAYIAKRNAVIQWIKDYLATGEKLVVFTYHVKALQDLVQIFKKEAVYLDGSVSGSKRQIAVDRFQNDDKVRLFIGQVVAAGIGITLTAAPAVAFVEFPWTSGDVEQASDRIHRIGQEADSVTAYFLAASDTVEEHIMDLLQGKYENVKDILDGEKGADLFDGQRDNLLGGLLKTYRKKIQEE